MPVPQLLRLLTAVLILTASVTECGGQTFFREKITIPSDDIVWTSHTATLDGGTVLLMNSYDTLIGFYFVTISKHNSAGQQLWHKRYGPGYLNTGRITATSDSGYIFCALDMQGSEQVVTKLDKNGNLVFSTALDPGSNFTYIGTGIPLERNEGGYYVAADAINYQTGVYVWNLMELDPNGTVLWSEGINPQLAKTYCADIDTMQNGDIMLLGTMYPFIHDPALARVSPNGTTLWIKHYANMAHDQVAVEMDITPADQVYIVAHSNGINVPFTYGITVLKTDGAGNSVWMMRYLGSQPLQASTIHIVHNNFIAVTAYNVFIGIDSTGLPLCSRKWPDVFVTSFDTVSGVLFSYSAIDEVTFDVLLFTSDNCGITCQDSTYDVTKALIPVSDSVASGQIPVPVVQAPYAQTEATANLIITQPCIILGTPEYVAGNPLLVYPNPANDLLYVQNLSPGSTVSLVDNSGRKIRDHISKDVNLVLGVTDLAPGIYTVVIADDQGIRTQKVSIVRP